MQRVSGLLPSWERRNSSTNKHHNHGLFGWSNRSSTSNPNGLSKINTSVAGNEALRAQREAFWPATLDIECEKAARILKAFCVDGYLFSLGDEAPPSPSCMEPTTPVKIPKRIPKRIIQNAAAIAIFSCMRNGLWMTGSGGSGILIARKSDGSWSPPSGIMLHTPTLSFIIGVDVYDCVLVISNLAALEAVTKGRVNLGDEIDLRDGQAVVLDSDESEVNWKELGNTVMTYMKARGQHQSVNLNGCILTERSNENERFYGHDVNQMEILAGNVCKEVDETAPLFEVIKMAEGRTDFDAAVVNKITSEAAPSDAIITTPKSLKSSSPRPSFGLVKADDPDPFGVLALEMAGLEIRQAGSRIRPTSSMFDLRQTPMSPTFSKFARQSVDTFASRSNRGSLMSTRTIRSQLTDAGTQTDAGVTPETTPSPGLSDSANGRMSPIQPLALKEEDEKEETDVDHATPVRPMSEARSTVSVAGIQTMPEIDEIAPQDEVDESEELASSSDSEHEAEKRVVDADSHDEEEADDADDDDDDDNDEDDTNDADDEDDEDEEEPVIFEVAAAVQPARTQAVASRMIQARGNVVTIAKRVPPPLPTRNPGRLSRIQKPEIGPRSSLRPTSAEVAPLKEGIGAVDPSSAEDQDMEKAVCPELRDEDAQLSSAEHADQAVTPLGEPKLELNKEAPNAEQGATAKLQRINLALLNEPGIDNAENSDSASHKKHTSSIYTGVTEDRWSFDGSSITTPTSERRFSITEEKTVEETPKRSIHELEKPESREPFSPLSETVTASPIAAT